jgi:hypothetical protein
MSGTGSAGHYKFYRVKIQQEKEKAIKWFRQGRRRIAENDLCRSGEPWRRFPAGVKKTQFSF